MLTLVRHGRTVANAGGRLQGRVDHPLDDLGHRQAEAAASSLVDAAVGVVVASPLRRAVETAEKIASATGSELRIDDRFIELDYGEFDDQPLASVSPETWARWRTDPEFAPPGGERLADLNRRVWAGLDDLAPIAREQHVVMVSHVSPMKSAVAWALGVEHELSWNLHVAQAAMCRIQFRGPRTALTSFNDVSHLEGIETP